MKYESKIKITDRGSGFFGFRLLFWPLNSPDFNPIEHVWDMKEKQVQSMARNSK